MTCIRCKHPEASKFGTYGCRKTQSYRCPSCNATFSEPHQKPLGRHYISTESAAQIVELLIEGMSIRSISRVTGVHKGTIGSLLLTVGNKCRAVFNSRVRNIHPRFAQADELWTCVHNKEKHLFPGDSPKWGHTYIGVAIDSISKWNAKHIRSPPASTQLAHHRIAA